MFTKYGQILTVNTTASLTSRRREDGKQILVKDVGFYNWTVAATGSAISASGGGFWSPVISINSANNGIRVTGSVYKLDNGSTPLTEEVWFKSTGSSNGVVITETDDGSYAFTKDGVLMVKKKVNVSGSAGYDNYVRNGSIVSETEITMRSGSIRDALEASLFGYHTLNVSGSATIRPYNYEGVGAITTYSKIVATAVSTSLYFGDITNPLPQFAGANHFAYNHFVGGTTRMVVNGWYTSFKPVIAFDFGNNTTFENYADIVLGAFDGDMPVMTNRYGLYITDLKKGGVVNAYGIYQSGSATANRFDGTTTFGTLGGSGTRMVVADANGTLSTQAIPAGSGSSGSGSVAIPADEIAYGTGTSITSSVTLMLRGTTLLNTGSFTNSGSVEVVGGLLNVTDANTSGVSVSLRRATTGYTALHWPSNNTFISLLAGGGIGFYRSNTHMGQFSSNSNFIVGTTADNGYRLQINGSASFAGTISGSGVNNKLGGWANDSETIRTTMGSNAEGLVVDRIGSSSTHGLYLKNFGGNVSRFQYNTSDGSTELGSISNGVVKFFVSGSEKARMLANGNFLINRTTDAGSLDRLAVSGSVSISGSLLVSDYITQRNSLSTNYISILSNSSANTQLVMGIDNNTGPIIAMKYANNGYANFVSSFNAVTQYAFGMDNLAAYGGTLNNNSGRSCYIYDYLVGGGVYRWGIDQSGSMFVGPSNVNFGMRVTQAGVTTLSALSGSGNRMVIVDASGTFSTQAIPSGSAGAIPTGEVVFGTGIGTDSDTQFFWDDTNKRLGIGAVGTSPSTKLTIISSDFDKLLIDDASSNSVSQLRIRTSGSNALLMGTGGSTIATTSMYASSSGYMTYSGPNGLRIGATGTGGAIGFYTNGSAVANLRMTITSAGVLNVANLAGTGTRVALVSSTGDVTVIANGAEGDALKIAGGVIAWGAVSGSGGTGSLGNGWTETGQTASLLWEKSGTDLMELTSGGLLRTADDVVTFYSFSDIRLKKNIQEFTGSGDVIRQLRPVIYQWKEGRQEPEIGFIAQEVEKVLPQVVREQQRMGDDTLYKTVDYEKMVALLTKGMQEQQEVIDDLKQRLKELENRFINYGN